jgi:hypothetical protein
MNCWICGNAANSGEHLIKASQLRALFGAVSQKEPLFYNSDDERNKILQSINSKPLKCKSLCAPCNNARSQRWDRAFERLMSYLASNGATLRPGQFVRLNAIFPYDTRHEAVRLHLYFVKLFGCVIAASQETQEPIPIDLAPLSDAIAKERPYQNLYVALGSISNDTLPLGAGPTDVHCELQDGKVVYAAWLLQFGRLWISLAIAAPGQEREGMRNAWHPSRAKRLPFKNLSGAPKNAPHKNS